MAEVKSFTFDYKEIAAALIKYQDLHEGIWGILLEFGISGANINAGKDNSLVPAAIIPVINIGLQQFPELNSLSVDAAEVNPAKKQETIKNKSSKKGQSR